MTALKLADREVTDIEMELEIGEGCYVTAARWLDTGEELTDAELDEFQHVHQLRLYEDAFADFCNRAHELMEGDR